MPEPESKAAKTVANTGHFLPRHKAGAPTRNKPSREEWKFTTHCSTDRGQGVLGDSRQGAAHLGSCLKLDFYLNLLKGRQGRCCGEAAVSCVFTEETAGEATSF